MMKGQWRFYEGVSVFGIVKEGERDEGRLEGGIVISKHFNISMSRLVLQN